MPLKKHIPNLLTLANLTCGVLACIAVLAEGRLAMATLLVLAGAVFDFFDGFAARLLRVSGEMGKQLDSLADMVTFGMVPSVTVYALLRLQMPHFTWLNDNTWLTFAPMLIAVFSAYRLAKFNIDTRQSESFIGMPTPANALFWMAIPMVVFQSALATDPSGNSIADFQSGELLAHPAILIGGSVMMSLLMVSELPLIALKFKHFKLKGNEWRYAFLIASNSALGVAGMVLKNVFAGIPVVILLYLVISTLSYRKSPRK